jgi:signal transduction histidine kinase
VIAESLVDRLVTHRMLVQVPRAQLVWLARHGSVQRFAAGDVTTPRGAVIEVLWIVLSGRVSIRIDRGVGPKKVTEWRGGDITGLLPYSRMPASPGDVVVEEATEAVLVHREHFPDMIRECPELTSVLVHEMLDRARHFRASDLHDDKLLALGRLTAGLAHELNNPASAVARSAKRLTQALADAEVASRRLGAAGLSEAQMAEVDRLRERCLAVDVRIVRSPIERTDREDAIADWVEAHGADAGVVESLAESAVTVEGLDEMAGQLDGLRLDTALRWVAAGCAVRGLSSEIESAASRIHHLVDTMKRFTHMDETAVPGPVDIGRGLADTVTLLQAKARGKSVGISLTIDPQLPKIQGFGGELNQVWMNLVDNALDAVSSSGHVEIAATRESRALVVRVVDDGSGMSLEVQERIFEPFFTTKPPGQGTGLGLEIVQRLVRRHDGVVDVESRPGRTEFRVTLPLPPEQPQANSQAN